MKLQLNANYFPSRTPLYLRLRNGIIYLQLQIEIADSEGLRAGRLCEYGKISIYTSASEIGTVTSDMIKRFHQIGDLTLNEFYELTGNDVGSYEVLDAANRLKFLGAKTEKEMNEEYTECAVVYSPQNHHYKIVLSWLYTEGKKKWRDGSDSTGKEGILTFEKPLEFDDDAEPEAVGEMILEAFDRSRKMAERMSGNTCPSKQVSLPDGTVIEVTPPKDRHFADFGDAGAGELFQVYSWLASENADSSADFILSCAPELYGDLSCENIKAALEQVYGKADEITASEGQYGMFQYRAVFRNKQYALTVYYTQIDADLTLACSMMIPTPNRKKRLTEKIPKLFEEYVRSCKRIG